MSGISSSVGLISGLDTNSLITQLLAVESRPKVLVQQRVAQLQTQQAAYLDINTKLSAIKTAALKLRTSSIFKSATVTSSKDDVLSGTASAGATPGSYSFLVDRLVSTQQLLSRGFADRNTSSVGLSSVSIEPAKARLDSDTELAQLNGGNGISRGKIVVTDSGGRATTVDLSRVATVGEVLAAFNTNANLRVSAQVQGGKLVLTDNSGGAGTFSVRSEAGYSTAASLGIEKSVTGSTTLSGDLAYYIGDSTGIQTLNDGNGIRVNALAGIGGTPDFALKTRDGTTYQVDVGDIWDTVDNKLKKVSAAPSTVAQLKARILSQTGNKVSLETTADGRGFRLVDSSTGAGELEVTDSSGAAKDLGFTGASTGGILTGRAVLAGLNSTLISGIRGGQGLSSGALNVQARDGTVFAITLGASGSLTDLLSSFSQQTGGKVTAALDANGTSIVLTDTTGGSGNLDVTGAAAADLGFALPTGGVGAATVKSARVNRQYVTESTLLTQLNGGRGVGTGTFDIVGPNGQKKSVIVGESTRTVSDLLKLINATGNGVRARINDAGNGILVEEDAGGAAAGGTKISITDTSGSVARGLFLTGTAAGTGTSNKIDGSQRRTIAIDAADTLDTVISKINDARAGVSAAVVTDGSSASPYRLKLASTQAGETGRFNIDLGGGDLGLTSIGEGRNARVFFGADDPARAILVSRASNSIDGVVDGLRADAKSVSDQPVTLTVSRDSAAIVSAVQEFVTAFNTALGRIDTLTSYDVDSDQKGTLLGDSTATALRLELFSAVTGKAKGVGGAYQFLGQVGVTVGTGGTLKLDETKLRDALDRDPQAVADVFSAYTQNDRPSTVRVSDGITATNTDPATYSSLGVLELVAQLADRYTNSVNGTLTNRGKSIDDQIKSQNDRIAQMDLRLADRKAYLQQQFATLETTLAQLQRQQAALTQIKSA